MHTHWAQFKTRKLLIQLNMFIAHFLARPESILLALCLHTFLSLVIKSINAGSSIFEVVSWISINHFLVPLSANTRLSDVLSTFCVYVIWEEILVSPSLRSYEMLSLRNNIENKYPTNYLLHFRLQVGWLVHQGYFKMVLTLQNQICVYF